MAQKLYICRGLPGSGKSTFAKKVFRCPVFENDMFFIHDEDYVYDTSKAQHAADWCLAVTEQSLKYGLDVCVANTFTKYEYIKPYIDLADKYNAEVKVFRMYGKFKDTHKVPAEVIEKMKSEFEEFDDEICVYPNINQDSNDICFRPYMYTKLKVGDLIEIDRFKVDKECMTLNISADGKISEDSDSFELEKAQAEIIDICQGSYDYLNVHYIDIERNKVGLAMSGDVKKISKKTNSCPSSPGINRSASCIGLY